MIRRYFHCIIIALSIVILLFAGCSSSTAKSSSLTKNEVALQWSDEELKEFMDNYLLEKKSHTGDETHWSRKIVAMGLNEHEHCLDITIIDCPDEIMADVDLILKDVPCNVTVTDHYLIQNGEETVEEHLYRKKDDGSIEELHFRAYEER